MPHTYETYSIGNSREGRAMPVHVFKSTGKELFRVLYYSQVHGTEDETRMACFLMIDDIKLNPAGYYDNVSIAIIPTCNVDGFAHSPSPTYTTPSGWDMDIDAIARITPETRNVFNFVKKWKPHVTVDGHNLNRYFSNVDYALERNLSRRQDFVIFKLETQTPRKDITFKQYKDMIKELNTLYPQYIIEDFWDIRDTNPFDGSRCRVSYYTPDPALIYQFMAQRYNTIGFLTEGISPFDLTDPEDYAEREELARRSNYVFLKYLINYFKQRPNLLPKKVSPVPQGTEIPVRWEQILEKPQFQSFSVEDRDTRADRHLISDEFSYLYEPTDFVTLPLGYAYPNTEEMGVVTWYLGPQYDYTLFTGSAASSYDIETIHIINAEDGEVPRRNDVHYAWQRAPKNVSTINVDSRMTNFTDWIIVFCDQEGGHMLPQLLEPTSQYALTRYYEDVGLMVIPDTDYIVKRLIKRIA